MLQQNIFRVSALIYAGNNYEVSPRQIHRKVIQDALFAIGDTFVSLGTLAEYINEHYSLLFSPEEISAVVNDPHFKNEFDSQDTGIESKYKLSSKRRQGLSITQRETLQDHINSFLEENKLATSNSECIMQFLYNMFTTNVDSFNRFLQSKRIIGPETKNKDTSPEDIAIINAFLDWNNEKKNIEIFNLACYALEYCLLTGKKHSHFTLESLKNKVFYLDTNILYRAIGINGDDRKKRALLFLSKFKSLNNELKITKSTFEEYQNSINNYIKKLRKSETPAINSSVYTEYVSMDDIWRFFHLWKSGRINGTLDYFANYLEGEFQSICDRYNIEVDRDQPFNENECEEEINNNASCIKGVSEKKPSKRPNTILET